MKELSPITKLLYCDTDSFIIKSSKGWYKEVEPIKSEFDFSKASVKFSKLLKISVEESKNNKGILGKYKSEIDKDDILMGYIALQKKCYCLLIMRQMKCCLCQNYTALCQCDVNYQGKQLYYIVDTSSAKGKDVKQLSFANYLESLVQNTWNCEGRYCISGVSQAYLRHISGISQAYLRHISGISQVYLRHISSIFQAYLRHVSDKSQAYLRLI